MRRLRSCPRPAWPRSRRAAAAAAGPRSRTARRRRPPPSVVARREGGRDKREPSHVSGSDQRAGQPLTLDIHGRGTGGQGNDVESGLTFEIIRIGNTAYIKGSDAFLRSSRAPPAHSSCTTSGSRARRRTATRRARTAHRHRQAVQRRARLSTASSRTRQRRRTTAQKVVAIRDTTDGSKLYVAATGKPYPVAIVGGRKGQSGTITFDNWNKTVSITAPKGAVDIAQARRLAV